MVTMKKEDNEEHAAGSAQPGGRDPRTAGAARASGAPGTGEDATSKDSRGEDSASTVQPSSVEVDASIDFSTFLLSLTAGALMDMHAQDVAALDGARTCLLEQTIDILHLLEQKTRGNLSGEEERLLAQVGEELRARLEEQRR